MNVPTPSTWDCSSSSVQKENSNKVGATGKYSGVSAGANVGFQKSMQEMSVASTASTLTQAYVSVGSLTLNTASLISANASVLYKDFYDTMIAYLKVRAAASEVVAWAFLMGWWRTTPSTALCPRQPTFQMFSRPDFDPTSDAAITYLSHFVFTYGTHYCEGGPLLITGNTLRLTHFLISHAACVACSGEELCGWIHFPKVSHVDVCICNSELKGV